MPPVIFFRDDDGSVPLLDWLDGLTQKARLACLARIELLEELGHQLRRPHGDYLQDGIYELRVKVVGVNYRVLYFFHGQQAIVLSHGITKQKAAVPPPEIERARLRKKVFEASPQSHTHKE